MKNNIHNEEPLSPPPHKVNSKDNDDVNIKKKPLTSIPLSTLETIFKKNDNFSENVEKKKK